MYLVAKRFLYLAALLPIFIVTGAGEAHSALSMMPVSAKSSEVNLPKSIR